MTSPPHPGTRTVPCCRFCLEADGQVIGLLRVRDADGEGGQWVCERSGHVVGAWLDGGELDLGVVRDPPGQFVRLLGGRLDGGLICGRCGGSTSFSIPAGEDLPPCRHCGRAMGGTGGLSAFAETFESASAPTFPEVVAGLEGQVRAAYLEEPRRRRVAVDGRFSWEDRPQFELWADWYDNDTVLIGLSWGHVGGDAMAGLDFTVARPPRWLARWVDRTRDRRNAKVRRRWTGES